MWMAATRAWTFRPNISNSSTVLMFSRYSLFTAFSILSINSLHSLVACCVSDIAAVMCRQDWQDPPRFSKHSTRSASLLDAMSLLASSKHSVSSASCSWFLSELLGSMLRSSSATESAWTFERIYVIQYRLQKCAVQHPLQRQLDLEWRGCTPAVPINIYMYVWKRDPTP